MWFSADEIRTKALQKLVFKNNNKLESKMIELLYEFLKATMMKKSMSFRKIFSI
jgi:hypothetical protein